MAKQSAYQAGPGVRMTKGSGVVQVAFGWGSDGVIGRMACMDGVGTKVNLDAQGAGWSILKAAV